jgi:exodeoxyribonuclease V alpha subunit
MANRSFASKLSALGIHPSMVEHAIESASQEHEVTLPDGRVKRLAPFVAVEDTPRGRSLTSISLYRSDVVLAEGLKRVHAGVGPLDVDAATAFRGVLPEGAQPSPDQVEAVEKVLRGGGVSVLTGGPGVGKTTISKAIINGLVAAGIRPILGMSPTGKAARRLRETTGLECSTIHSALTLVENSEMGPSEFSARAIIVDESSMLSTELGARLISRVATGTRVIFVGDVDQLPSIDPGAVLRDLIAADCFSVARLTQVHRQDEFSLIPEVAKAINEGRAPDRVGGDCCFVEAPDADAVPSWVYQYLVETMPNYITSIRQQRGKDGVAVPADIQVIAPMKKGPVGTMALNLFIQDKVTGQGTKEFDVPIRTSGGVQMSARSGDRVIHKKNDRELGVVNGEVGYVVDSDPMGVETHSYSNLAVKSDGTSAKHVLVVRYEDGAEEKHVAYTKAQARDLELAYALTIHSYQGSQSPGVILVLHPEHKAMLTRGIAYTGLTRAAECALIIGTSEAVGQAAARASDNNRRTRLAERLGEDA